MKTDKLNKLSRIERFIYSIQRKIAERSYIKREIKTELYKIKYGKEKPEKKPWTWFKWACFGVIVISVIVAFFSMYATLMLSDSQMIVALIGALATILGSLVTYGVKSTKENTSDGIVFETTMAQLQKNNEDAQG